MRILFTTLPHSGHFHPLAPIARAAADAGHEVAFACAASFMPAVEAAGFRAFPVGYDARGQPREMLFPALRTLTDSERADWMGPYVFIGIYGATMVPDLIALSRHWPPDVIVRDSAEFGGCVAAETLGLPHASVRTSAMSAAYARRSRYREALAPLRARSGLPPDSDDAMPFRYLPLAFEPPGFWPADEPPAAPRALRPFGRRGFAGVGGAAPSSADNLRDVGHLHESVRGDLRRHPRRIPRRSGKSHRHGGAGHRPG